MSLIYSDFSWMQWAFPTFIVTIALMVGWLFFLNNRRNNASGAAEKRATLQLGAVGLATALVAFGGFVVLMTFIILASNGTIAARIAHVEDTYGLEMSTSDFNKLEYPPNSPKEGTFEAYGTAVLTSRDSEGGLSQRQATLVWNLDELQLVEGKGAVTELEELPRVG